MDWKILGKAFATAAIWISFGYFSGFREGTSMVWPAIVTIIIWLHDRVKW